MAETGDIIQEFKHAKPPEKMVIVLGAIAVVGIGGYLYVKNKSASTTGTTDPNAATTAQTSGYPTANGVPILPAGVNPQYDPNGNLVDYQNSPTTTTTPSTNPFTWPAALAGMKIWKGSATGNYLFGPKGPQPGRTGQTLLSTLFPVGTTFGGSTGSSLTYTLPGASSPTVAPVILGNPNSHHHMRESHTHVAEHAKKRH